MNKLKRFNKVLSFLAVFIMVVQSLISPVLAEREATVNNSESTEIRYAELTGDWSNDGLTNRFVVNYNGEDWHTGVCLEPTKNTPYGDMDYSTSYDGSSGIGRVLYWTIGRGYNDHLYGASGTDYGPLSYEARFIIAHFAASYEANGGWDDGWTWMVGDGWRDAIIDIRNWCVNSGLNEGDGCEVIRVTPNDSGTSTQELALYWDWYTPPSHTDNYGKVDVNKVDINSGSNINGAIFGVFFYREDAEHATWDDTYGLGRDSGSWLDVAEKHYAVINTGSGAYGVSGDLWVGQDDDITENYYVKELKAPSGYKLDTNVYKVEVKKGQTVRCANIPGNGNFGNDGRRSFSFYKTVKNDKTGTSTPEAGAEFEIKNSSGTVVETITTDANGLAQSSSHPYGTYTVHQTKGSPSAMFISDFIVTLDSSAPYDVNKAIDGTKDDMATWLTTTATDANYGAHLPHC